MKKINWLLMFMLAVVSVVSAQEKMLTIDEIFDPAKRVPFSGRPISVQWAEDGLSFRQFQGGNLLRINALTGQSTPFYDTKKLASALSQTPGFSIDEASKIAQSPLRFNETNSAIIITHNNDLWLYSTKTETIKRLTNNKEDELEADFSPDGKMISFVRGMNLFTVDIATGKLYQLTRDGSETILNGYLDWVYEEELYGRGNKRGYWWSPDSKTIAFLRTDESPVKNFTVVNHEGVYQTVETTPYPKAGAPNPLVKLAIVDAAPANAEELKIGNIKIPENITKRLPNSIKPNLATFLDLAKYKPEDLLIGRVTWSPDSQAVIFQALNREQTFLDVNAGNKLGKVTTIFTEKTPAYVEVYDNPFFLKDGTIIWQSARNGWRHLYQIDQKGKVVRQLTDGKWEIRDFYGVDEKNGWAYFQATKDSHIATNVYRVKLDGSKIEKLTKGDGTHSGSFNSTFTHFVSNWSDVNTPPQTRLYKADGSLEKVLNENKVEVLSQYKLGKPEFLKVKTRDGFEMEAMMIKPPNFDPSKKYPVWSFTYSGPHAPSVRNAWGGSQYMWFQMLAQKGYVIWVCDNRSASGKGEESTWTAYKNLGVGELRDLEDGANYLKSLPYIDGERIGLSGWSYGGFMTSYAMTHSKTWKIGIAGGSVTDWQLYDSIYTERYMQTPQNNPQGYEKTSVVKAAKDLNGKLLLVHGVIDDNVHLQNTMQFVYELQKAGKQFELMVYPTQRHGVVNPLQSKHMRQMMTDFILKNL